MFGSKKTSSTNTSPNFNGNSGAGHALNSIVAGTSVVGDIKADTDLRVDGSVEGTIHCSAKIIVGATGSIEGTVVCENAVIEGKLKGDLQVGGLLDVRDSATLDGVVHTQKLLVAAGAKFNVECTMGGKKEAAISAQAAQQQRSNKTTSQRPAANS